MAEEATTEKAPEPTQAPTPKVDAAPVMTQAEREELQALREMRAEQERQAAEVERAKLTEAERIKAEREALARDRFVLEAEKIGVPADLVDAVASGDPKKVARAWAKAEELLATKFRKGPAGAQVNPATGTDQATPKPGKATTAERYIKLLQGKR